MSHPNAAEAGGGGGFYILSLGLHGLVRGSDIELGRDADTGGQTTYVVEQARALAELPEVDRVDLVTRQVEDRRIDAGYAEPIESISANGNIVRVPFGPRRYLYKESFWPYLDSARDQIMRHLRSLRRAPDVVHGHYADAGYVGAQLSKVLGVPFVFTGHSLGRVKKARLLEQGGDPDTLERRYHIAKRIEAEERSLETAALVIASTHQEVQEQYELYDHYRPERMVVIPPGVDLSRFGPPTEQWQPGSVAEELARFLRRPDKPMVLAIARADERKNFATLIQAFAGTPELRDAANLVLIPGSRDDIKEMEPGPRRVLNEILLAIDRHDLYGLVAYPKHNDARDIVDLYRLATRSRGVFVNPALTEPFGLTLIEAAASGLPLVATDDGGPNDIIGTCQNGLLVDPTDARAMASAILQAVTSKSQWDRWSRSGLERAQEFSWPAHVERYLQRIRQATSESQPALLRLKPQRRLPKIDRVLVSDIDNTLTGDPQALRSLVKRLEKAGPDVGFGVATGRRIEEALAVLKELGTPEPDVLITTSGTELYYGRGDLTRDQSWQKQIDHEWFPDRVRETIGDLPGLTLREDENQGPYRVRYDRELEVAPSLQGIRRALRQAGLRVTTIVDHQVHVDILPIRASPGAAIRFFCFKWDLPPWRLLIAGDSGNDADMLSGDTLGVVVGNYSPELEYLRGRPRVFFAEGTHAEGILEGIDHYDFFGAVTVPSKEPE